MPPGTEPQKVGADTGWAQLAHTLSRKMPQRLHAAGKTRQALTNLTRAKGR